ncbi:ATP-binding cassette domain-containing protein [Bifidobacterium sp. M3-R-103]|uniref:methionine ABC transporter ATP-binding protein n=1 Tax=Bifidobacterium sp. M3-R-103 TaxID=2949652 RepID=UPI00202FC038|nr:ATP-binding cassette domain-containing protein [Bifidobacterium sp. M3-R-103]MCM0692497.1 ATP-binding cassette domain-containing protein [Bifidobacterium sp. M3-R-103]
MSVIELNDVSVTFHEGGRTVEAVKHVNISVEKGEIFGIVGFSGAGKSTLVRTINLLERPTGGHVVIEGNDITALKGIQLSDLRKKIGFIFQGFNLITNVTVGKNIEFALKAGGYPKAQWPERVRELLALVGLENKIDSYPSSLSGGQKQRVSIARALANKPEILLCDEATSALDLETTEGILALLQRINRELGITIVFITHQLDVAKQIFDRVAVMENGVVVEQGNTFDVFSAPKHPTTKALVERYLGIAVPPQLVPSLPAGTIVELRYKGDAALEPLISQVAQDYGVSIDVLHANVEYFGSQAIGILIVLVSGAGEPLLQALNTLRTHVFSYRELDRGQLVVATEAADNQEA